MRIDIAVEEKHAHFSVDGDNFPYKFLFLDRTTGIIIDVHLDSETFRNLLNEMKLLASNCHR